MRGIAEWHVFIPNEAFLVAKSALGPHGGQSTTYAHDTGKIGRFFEVWVFSVAQVGLGVDGPHKAAGRLQNTPGTRLLLAAAGSQSAL